MPLLIMLGVALLFISLGFMIWKKQKITLIHSYHYEKVKEENIELYTKGIGQGIIIIGMGCAFTGIFNYICNSSGGWIFFGLAFFYGMLIIIKTQNKYNGGLF